MRAQQQQHETERRKREQGRGVGWKLMYDEGRAYPPLCTRASPVSQADLTDGGSAPMCAQDSLAAVVRRDSRCAAGVIRGIPSLIHRSDADANLARLGIGPATLWRDTEHGGWEDADDAQEPRGD